MKKYIINLIFLILPLYSFTQTVQEQFAGFGNISSVTSLGSSNYTVVLTGFTGSPRFEVNGTWTGSDVAVGNVIFRDGARYVITLVNSSSSGGFNVRVNSPDEGLGVSALNNGDIVAVGAEYMGLFPIPRQGDNAGTGVPPSLASSIYIHNMKIMGNLGADYITTDSFSTFTNGSIYNSIPINKTVWSTTRGSKWEKTGVGTMTRRSTDNGLNASTIANTSNDSIQFNANLNNRVQITTGNVTNAYVLDPLYYQAQSVGETFVIGVQAGTSNVTVNWSSVFGIYTGTTFNVMPTTVVPAQSVMTFTFRVITTSSEVTKFHYVDGSGGSTTPTTASNGASIVSNDVKLGNTFITANPPSRFLETRKIDVNGFSLIFGDDNDSTLLVIDGLNDAITIDLKGTGDFSILDNGATSTPVLRGHDNGDVTFGLTAPNPTNFENGLFFDYSKQAMRGGVLGGSGNTTWSDANIGTNSFGWGTSGAATASFSWYFGNGKATATYAGAIGSSTASGQYAFAGGNASTASGVGSYTFGTTVTSSGVNGVTFGETSTNAGDYTSMFTRFSDATTTADESQLFGTGLNINAFRVAAIGHAVGATKNSAYTSGRRFGYFNGGASPSFSLPDYNTSNTISSVSGDTIVVASTASYTSGEWLVLESGATNQLVRIVEIVSGTRFRTSPSPSVSSGNTWAMGNENFMNVSSGLQDFIRVNKFGQLIFPLYTSTSAYTGTPIANLAVTSSGNVIPTTIPANCTLSITQSSHGFSVGNIVYWTGSAYANIAGNFGSVTTPSGIVTSVTSANVFVLTTCGPIATDLGLADGLYYATNSGLSTTASSPEMPMFKAEGANGIVNPMLALDSGAGALFTITTTNGANSIINGETFVLRADSILSLVADTLITGDASTTAITPTAKFYSITVNTSAAAEPITLPAPISTYRNVHVEVKAIGSATNAITISSVGGGSNIYDGHATATSSVIDGGSSKTYKCVLTTSPSTYSWVVQ